MINPYKYGCFEKGFTPTTYFTIEDAIFSFVTITDIIKNRPPDDPIVEQAMIYLLQISPLILGFPKGGGDVGEYVADPSALGSPMIKTADPAGSCL